MTRLAATAFGGSTLYKTEADAYTFRKVLELSAQELALVADLMSGDNSPPASSTIDHRGDTGTRFRGAPMGVPIMNQLFELQQVGLVSASTEPVWLFVVPFFLPRPETIVFVELACTVKHPKPMNVRIYDSSLVDTGSVGPMAWDDDNFRYYAIAEGLTNASGEFFLVIDTIVTPTDTGCAPTTLSVHFNRKGDTSLCEVHPENATDTWTVPTTTSSNATIFSPTWLDGTLVVNDYPYHAYAVTRQVRNIAGVDEVATGAPACGNAAFSLDDGSDNYGHVANITASDGVVITLTGLTGVTNAWLGCSIQLEGTAIAGYWGTWAVASIVSGTSITATCTVNSGADGNNGAIRWLTCDPTVSAFFDHSQAGKANEPLVDMCLWAEAFGSINAAGTVTAMTSWNAASLLTYSSAPFAQVPIYIPDGPRTAGTSKLKCKIICAAANNASFAAFIASGVTSVAGVVDCYEKVGGTTAGRTTANFAALSGRFATATITGIPYYADRLNVVDISLDAVDGGKGALALSDFVILGAALYLDA